MTQNQRINLAENILRRVLRNMMKLAAGKAAGGVMGLIALAFMGRGLPPEEFGMVLLIFNYPWLAASFGEWESWQMILHYASAPLKSGQMRKVRKVLHFGVGLDLLTSLGVTAAAMLILLFWTDKLGMPRHYLPYALAACLLILGRACSFPYGILRLFDRVGLLAAERGIAPAIQAFFSFLAWQFSWGFAGFFSAWFLSRLFSQIYLFAVSLCISWRYRGFRRVEWNIYKASKKLPKGAWGLLCLSSLNLALESSWRPLTTLLVGAALGPADAGFFVLAMTVMAALCQPAKMLEQNYYPEMARLNPRERAPWFLALQMAFLSSGVGAIVVALILIGGKPLISLFGVRYGTAAPLLAWLSPAVIFSLSGLCAEAVLYTSGKARYVLGAEFFGLILYLASLLLLSPLWHLKGVAAAWVIGQAALNLALIFLSVSVFLKRHQLVLPHERETDKGS